MEPPSAEDYLSNLRLELKAWEREFSARNGGRKAGRDDIKRDETIAAKYKEYNRLRSADASKPPTSPSRTRQPSKSNGDSRQILQTPRATQNISKQEHSVFNPPPSPSPHVAQIAPSPSKHISLGDAATPTHNRLFVTSIGPTPQKNGRALGLFDLLSSAESTPKHPNRHGLEVFSPTRAALTEATSLSNVLVTPSATRKCDADAANRPSGGQTPVKGGAANTTEEDPEEIMTGRKRRWARTPGSGHGGRFWMDLFVTPSKRRRLFDGEFGAVVETPKKEMGGDTPQFLRRDPTRFEGLDTLAEEEDEVVIKSPEMVAKPWRRGLRRTVSSVVERLRRAEEERQMEEEERARREDSILREVEAGWAEEEVGLTQTEPVAKPKVTDQNEIETAIQEPQPEDDAVDMIPETQDIFATSKTGEEDRFDEDFETTEALVADDPSEGFVRKKKGQKRQTKRVIMRPVRNAPTTNIAQTKPVYANASDSEDSEEGAASENGSNYGDEAGCDAEGASRSKRNSASEKEAERSKKPGQKRTVNPLAHANFRALKIKNKNSKARGRGRYR